MTLRLLVSIIAIICLHLLSPMPGAAQPEKTIYVFVSCGGDDGLTQKLCDQIQVTFRDSHKYKIYTKQFNLEVMIPTNVRWDNVNGRKTVIYQVKYLSNNRKLLAKDNGSCLEENLDICAKQVLDRAGKLKR